MSKKTETTVADGSSVSNEAEQPKTQVLTAATREDLFQQVEKLKATLTEGQALTTGAVGRNCDNGQYTLRIDIF